MKKNILIFGDSIAWGAWDFEKEGWADKLKNYLSKKMIYVYNLGIPGDNSKYLLERFENEILSRWEKEDGELIIIITVGINDSQYLQMEERTKIDINEFKKNIEKLSEKAKIFTDKIIFIGLTNVDEKVISGEKKYSNKYIKNYDSVIKNFCKTNNIQFIPLFNSLDNSDLIDGLHPNSKGHEKIFKKVRNFLSRKK